MKKLVFFFLLTTALVQGQYRLKYDKLFLESGIGLGVPLSQYSPSGDGNGEISLLHFQGGLRYMFNESIGLLGTLNYDGYKNSKDEKSEQKLVGLELVYNLGNAFDLSRNTRETMGLLIHGGIMGGAMSSKYNTHDYVGAITFGIKPLWALNNKVSFYTDLSFKHLLEQDVFYNGVNTKYPNPGKFTSSQMGLTFGVIVALGQNRSHADLLY